MTKDHLYNTAEEQDNKPNEGGASTGAVRQPPHPLMQPPAPRPPGMPPMATPQPQAPAKPSVLPQEKPEDK
jgi:hypothetical protein